MNVRRTRWPTPPGRRPGRPGATWSCRNAALDHGAVHGGRAGDRIWLVRITDITAVPMEPAVCWMMFIIVEPRAIWWCVRLASAADMIGIIVMPMPMPITNSAPSSSRYGVVGGHLGEHAHAGGDQHDAGEDELAGADLVGQPAGDRHGEHRAEALRRQQQAGASVVSPRTCRK